MQMRIKNVGKMGVMRRELRFKDYDMKYQTPQQHCFFFVGTNRVQTELCHYGIYFFRYYSVKKETTK